VSAPVWPDGRRFAFSIFDDTDATTLATGRPVYDLLTDLGLLVTKSVWPLGPERLQTVGGSSCAEPDYLAWVLELQAAGHEIGYHHASDHSSERARTIAALDRFRDLFGHDPRVGADHAGNRESLDAGAARLSGWRRRVYHRVARLRQPDRPPFLGAVPGSPWFWGDVCRERITYWRGLTFARTDLCDVGVPFPYHDPSRPYVNRWFLSSDAPRLEHLLARLAPAQLDRLERQGGVCILYTHLGLDAAPDGVVDPRLVRALTDLAGRGGWCAPVSRVLDHLHAGRGGVTPVLSDRERARLERRWIVDRVRHRAPLGPRVQTVEPAPA
jgi:hypothetical protein